MPNQARDEDPHGRIVSLSAMAVCIGSLIVVLYQTQLMRQSTFNVTGMPASWYSAVHVDRPGAAVVSTGLAFSMRLN